MSFLLPVAVLALLFLALAGVLLLAEMVLVNYGTCTIDINSGGRVLEVDGGQSLLNALYGEKVFIPSACGGRGSCGYCKVVVASGGGPLLPTETPYLSRREARANTRLACQVKVRGDIELRIPEDLLNVKLFDARVESATPLTHDIKEIKLSLVNPEEIEQRPGQYVQVQAPSPEGPVFRAYSISSPVYEKNRVELVVRLVPGGVGSTYIHHLNPGDKVTLTGPFGEFRLNEDPSVEIVCVGGGCGMAPMRNIIHTVLKRWPERSIWLFFGCRTTKDIFYYDEFKELQKEHPNFHVVYALSDPLGPGEQWEGETGFIHLSADKFLEPNVPRQAFLCGPPPMIEAVTGILTKKGLKPEDVFYDKF
jgi:Na+-transporting NADH:ubiquinone oxidoreductase subunit F